MKSFRLEGKAKGSDLMLEDDMMVFMQVPRRVNFLTFLGSFLVVLAWFRIK